MLVMGCDHDGSEKNRRTLSMSRLKADKVKTTALSENIKQMTVK